MNKQQKECCQCLHARGKWRLWKRTLVCRKYGVPATQACIDFVQRNRSRHEQKQGS